MKVNIDYAPDTYEVDVKTDWGESKVLEDSLDEYGLHVVQSEKNDRTKIDFRIVDENGTFCAEVSGDDPNYVEIDCEHPVVEFGDEEETGECPICGAWAVWHWQESADDGYTIKEQVVDTWDYQNVPGGIIGNYLKELKRKW